MEDEFDHTDPDMLQLRSEYIDTVIEQFESVEQEIIDLEKTGDSAGTLSKICGDIHSVKGSAGSFGMPIITEACHHIEDILATIDLESDNPKSLSQEHIDHILVIMDLSRKFLGAESQMYQPSTTNEEISERDKFVNLLNKEIESLNLDDSHKSIRVLFIDYSKTAFLLLSHQLKETNLVTNFETDGLKGLEEALKNPYDFVVCGNNVNNLNGKAIISALQFQFGSVKPETIFIGNLTEKEKANFKPNHCLPRSNQLGTQIIEIITNLQQENKKLSA